MPEGNQKQSEIQAPDASIKQTSIDAHTLASNNLRAEANVLGNFSDPEVSNLISEADQHEAAVSILGKDQRDLPGKSKSTIRETSNGLTPSEAFDAETIIPAYLRSKKQDERKKLDGKIKGPEVVMKDKNGNNIKIRSKQDVRGGTFSNLDPINYGKMTNGEPTREYSLEEDAGEINNN